MTAEKVSSLMPENVPGPTAWGQLIRVARDACGLSLAQAARIAGVNKDGWGYIERGYQNLGGRGVQPRLGSASMVARMAHAVGVTPGRLDEAGRPDAAEVLREIEHRGDPAGQPEQLAEWVMRELLRAGHKPAQVDAFLAAENLPGRRGDQMPVDFWRRLSAALGRGMADVMLDAGVVSRAELGEAQASSPRLRSLGG